MPMKLVVRSTILNIVSVYAPQTGLGYNITKQLWKELDMVI